MELPPFLQEREVILMKNSSKHCYSLRIKLEKLKQKTCFILVLARFLVFLVAVVESYLRQP